MNDLVELLGIIVGVILIIALAIGIVSLPFAFLGWILLSAAAVFTPISITYMSSVVVGLVVIILAALISS